MVPASALSSGSSRTGVSLTRQKQTLGARETLAGHEGAAAKASRPVPAPGACARRAGQTHTGQTHTGSAHTESRWKASGQAGGQKLPSGQSQVRTRSGAGQAQGTSALLSGRLQPGDRDFWTHCLTGARKVPRKSTQFEQASSSMGLKPRRTTACLQNRPCPGDRCDPKTACPGLPCRP